MLRSCVTQFLILLVVICPYFCLGEEGEGAAKQSSASPCCCNGGPVDSDNDTPQPQDQGDSDCLCHGAILDGVEAAATEAGAHLFVTAFLDLRTDAVPFQISADVSLNVCHFPPLSTGRDICALTCALLL